MKVILVGMHFNPPSKTLLASLREGAEVELRREDGNVYDSAAVEVWVERSEFDWEILEELVEELEASGTTLRDLRERKEWRLGHVGASNGKPLAKARRLTGEELYGNVELRMKWRDEAFPKGRLQQTGDGLVAIEIGEGE